MVTIDPIYATNGVVWCNNNNKSILTKLELLCPHILHQHADTSCSTVAWGVRVNNPNTVQDWLATCTPGGGGTCERCDWWPARSSAPWHYDVATVPLTCGVYMPDGAAFPCTARQGYQLDATKSAVTSPSYDRCCTYVPTCSRISSGGAAYTCAGAGLILDPTKVNNTSPSDGTCCKTFVATCGMATVGGSAYACPTDGMYVLANASSTAVSVTECCRFVPTCSAPTPGASPYACTTAGMVTATDVGSSSPASDLTCCRWEMQPILEPFCDASATGPPPAGLAFNVSTNGSYCYYPSCGALPWLNDTMISFVASYICLDAQRVLPAVDTNISDTTCCFPRTCSAFWTNGTAYTCPNGYTALANATSVEATVHNAVQLCCVRTCYVLRIRRLLALLRTYLGSCTLRCALLKCLRTRRSFRSCTQRRLHPDLSFAYTMSPSGGTVLIGGTAGLSVRVSNAGEWQAENVTVRLHLPNGLQLDSASPGADAEWLC